MTRRSSAAVLCCLVVGLLSTTGCQPGAEAAPDSAVVQIGSTKADLFGMPAEFRALHPLLEKRLDRQVRFRAQPDGPALSKQLELGHIHYAIMSAAEYASIENPGKLTLLATGINALGKTSRKAFLVVKAGSRVKTIDDCRGKRFAFGKHRGLLTDFAARRALNQAGVKTNDLLPELLTPPPFAFDGRLYCNEDVAKTIASDITVNAGVIEEVTFQRMPETGGNFITGPSRDQFKIVGETESVPEIVVIAGPEAEAECTARLEACLFEDVKNDARACRQLGVHGFAAADPAAYLAVRRLLPKRQSP